MMERQHATSYDEVPYPGFPFPQTHPDRLATIATLFGASPTAVDQCRVLELGCTDGANLIPMALNLPGSEFVGVDFSQRQIDTGLEIQTALGIDNLSLLHRNILDVDDEFGQFDYIIVHGILSWVPDEVQQKIFKICHGNLNPNGIAYISYNTYPGWHMRGMLRDMMRFHTRQFTDKQQQVDQARALIEFLTESVPTENNAYGMLLSGELQEMKGWLDAYIMHDSLEEFNEPFYFHRFIEEAQEHGLQYLGEAEFRMMLLDNLPAKVSETLSRICRDLVEMEQYMDFVRNRVFRQTLLCHRDIKLDHNVKTKRLNGMSIGTQLRPASENPDLGSDQPEQFRTTNEATLTTTEPLEKAAFTVLAEVYPGTLSLEELIQRCHHRLSGAASDGSESFSEESIGRLKQSLLTCYGNQLVQLHVHAPRFIVEVTERPTASPLARLQARKGFVVTNQQHMLVNIDVVQQHLLPHLDGQNDRNQLLSVLENAVDEGGIQATTEEGEKLSDSAAIRSLVTAQLDSRLQDLAKKALLIS